MQISYTQIYCHIKANQSNVLNQEVKFDRLGRRIRQSTPGLSPIERFINKILINDITGCWEWQGAEANGYGQFKPYNSSTFKTSPHKFIYEYLYGEVSEGKELDHIKCSNRICCNPKHLKEVTHAENVKRRRKVRCVNNHLMNDENIYVSPKGGRFCKKCRTIAVNKSLKKRMKNDSEFREKRKEYMRKKSKEFRDSKV